MLRVHLKSKPTRSCCGTNSRTQIAPPAATTAGALDTESPGTTKKTRILSKRTHRPRSQTPPTKIQAQALRVRPNNTKTVSERKRMPPVETATRHRLDYCTIPTLFLPSTPQTLLPHETSYKTYETRFAQRLLHKTRYLVHDELLDGPILVAAVRQIPPNLDGDFPLPQLLHGDLQGVGLVLDVHHHRRVHAGEKRNMAKQQRGEESGGTSDEHQKRPFSRASILPLYSNLLLLL